MGQYVWNFFQISYANLSDSQWENNLFMSTKGTPKQPSVSIVDTRVFSASCPGYGEGKTRKISEICLLSTMINHNFSPPFGIICLELYPSIEDSQIQVIYLFLWRESKTKRMPRCMVDEWSGHCPAAKTSICAITFVAEPSSSKPSSLGSVSFNDVSNHLIKL